MKAVFLLFLLSTAFAQPDGGWSRWTIRCDGPPPVGSPPGVTLQKVCAKPDTAGFNPVRLLQLQRSIKGYCFANGGKIGNNAALPPVSFEYSDTPATAGSSFWRKAQLCKDRCWCHRFNMLFPLDPLLSLDVKPAAYPRESTVQRAPKGGNFPALVLDIDGLIENRYVNLNNEQRFSTILQGDQHLEETQAGAAPSPRAISIDESNLIECSTTWVQRFGISKPLGSFLARLNSQSPFAKAIAETLGVPYPSNNTQWGTIRNLCATALAGGDPGANAGGYCSNNPFYSAGQRDLSFSDDWTPRGEWTARDNWEFSLRVRTFCFQSCRCKGTDEKTVFDQHAVTLQQGWRMNQQTTISRVVGENGAEFLNINVEGKKSSGIKGWFSPRQKSCSAGDAEPGTCANPDPCIQEGYNICETKPWPVDELGPVPAPTAETIDKAAPTCGSVCDSARSCGLFSSRSADCKCAYLTTQLRRQLNLIGVTTLSLSPTGSQVAALCLQLDVLKKLRRPTLQGLGGRAVPGVDEVGELEEDVNCMCNATYASTKCCDSESGMVWEDEAKALRL
ncbi:MAG: hypothetical protein M1814_001488 [Vezdaea aestivalis]|nr:MAG: hypothetical protein M1814_001488 [Vezdaea aestivalis]